ncbi:MAG: imidazole glycerol phosphate synthase subunit HisH [Acetobacteraceae bacterium]|nr:imidazole glycerol phosphate synthase subunit HisH [Acetobacteraceae bacterium]
MSGACAVIDYGSGNLRSAAKALARAAADHGCAARIVVTDDAAQVRDADRVVIPGVGSFADCRAGLFGIPGMLAALEAVRAAGRPILGICVGMQLMAERGFEHGVHAGLGWLHGSIRRLDPPAGLRVPQMGWNRLDFTPGHALLAGIAPGDYVYFVHSYALADAAREEVLASTDYGGSVVAAVARGNLAGTQFHPEKSQETGLRFLANFLAWQPCPPAGQALPDQAGKTLLTGSC